MSHIYIYIEFKNSHSFYSKNLRLFLINLNHSTHNINYKVADHKRLNNIKRFKTNRRL